LSSKFKQKEKRNKDVVGHETTEIAWCEKSATSAHYSINARQFSYFPRSD